MYKRQDNTISEHERNTKSRISLLQNKIKEIGDLAIQNNTDVHDKYDLIANSLTSVKNELWGEIHKNISSINERVVVTRDFYNEIELENFSHDNRVIHPMRF